MPDPGNEGIADAGRGIRERIKALTEVPALPLTLLKILRTLNNENATIQDLEEIIRHDQSLASRVISIANSPYYHGRNRVTINSLDQAILLLGFNAVRSISLGIAIFRSFPLPYRTLRQMWAHSYRVAVAAGFLGARIRESDEDIAFCAGLLHDIGRAVLIAIGEQESLEELTDFRGQALLTVERERFSCSHAEAGYWFLEEFSLPEEILGPVLRHHDGAAGERHEAIAAAVYVAEAIVGGVDDPAADGEWNEQAREDAKKYGVDDARAEECRQLLSYENAFLMDYFDL